MNTIQRMVALAALCLMATSATHAQDNETSDKPASELQKKWFTIDNTELRYNVIINLNKGESLNIRFKRLSDWTNARDFLDVFNAADKAMLACKDSFEQEQNTRILDVYIPANKKNIISRFSQYNESGSLMTINDDGASSLKVGMDTLRILQAKTATSRIQYTFLLKNISNYNTYTKDEAWKDKTATLIDSVMNEYKRKWKKPNAARHGLDITYTPAKNSHTVSETWRMQDNRIMIEGGWGVSLVRNVLCPNIEYGVGIYIDRDKNTNTFVRLSSNYFYRYVETATNKIKGYATGFVNLELGTESNRYNPKSLFYKTSVGFGYKLINKNGDDRDPTMDKQMYRIFFSYSMNKFLALTPEIVSNFRKGDRNNSWIGLSLNLKIF